ncbi:MAG: relaxase/mobilization nuclease domain-containing protein [Bdellovibrionales bacterium]
MILKSCQRAGGDDIATHLLNALDNEQVEVAEISGAVADDLHGAFAEFEAIASGTRAREYLYSLSINPPAPLTREQYGEVIAAIEDRLGLAGQPRAIVFHIKRDKSGQPREHCHVVWSRIDAAKMRAVHLSHDHRKLCDLACELARRFGLDLPPGLEAWEAGQRFEKERPELSLAEIAQEARSGITPEEHRAVITAAFERADSGEAFRAALAEAGYILAHGDRRGFVVLDESGEVHSLSRYVDGHTARQIRSRLAPLTPGELPGVADARILLRSKRSNDDDRRSDEGRALAEKAQRMAHQVLDKAHAARRTELVQQEQALYVRQASEKLALHAAQETEARGLLFRVRRAVAALLRRLPALRSIIRPFQEMAGIDPDEHHALERRALAGRHVREKQELARRKRALCQVEKRERQSLERFLRRLLDRSGRSGRGMRRAFAQAAKDYVIRGDRAGGDTELFVLFNDAAEFVEGPPDGDDDGDADHDQPPRWQHDGDDGRPRRRRRKRRGLGRD